MSDTEFVYRVTAVESVPAYVEGTEPKLYDFLLMSMTGDDSVARPRMSGYNFTREAIKEGQSVYLVLDMFQRWVVSSGRAETISYATSGCVTEAAVSSPYRAVTSNFVPTDNNGVEIPKEQRDTYTKMKKLSIFCWQPTI